MDIKSNTYPISINNISLSNIKDFNKIIDSPILITCNKAFHDQETSNNMWAISIEAENLEYITVEDLLKFITNFLTKKRKQIVDTLSSCAVVFYMWFDEMAAQLRFNIISDYHQKLPFGCKINIVNEPNEIINNFIKSQENPEISWNELEEVSLDDNDFYENDFILEVFIARLN